MPEKLNQWSSLAPKQEESPTGYGARTGGMVTVADGRWSCTGCRKSESDQDPHHAAQIHAAACLAAGF